MRTRLFYAIGLGLALSSCAASHPTAPADVPAVATATPPDSLDLRVSQPLDTKALGLPPYLVPPPAGSTPRQRRQWQRAQTQNLARAGLAPTKIKNSSVATAPGASAVNRASAPVATGPGSTATDTRKAGTRGGAVAVGPGAVATATAPGVAWWWYLVAALVGAVGWEVLTSECTPLRLLLKWRKVT